MCVHNVVAAFHAIKWTGLGRCACGFVCVAPMRNSPLRTPHHASLLTSCGADKDLTWWSKGKLEAAGKGPTPEEIRAEELRRVKVLCQSMHGMELVIGEGGWWLGGGLLL